MSVLAAIGLGVQGISGAIGFICSRRDMQQKADAIKQIKRHRRLLTEAKKKN